MLNRTRQTHNYLSLSLMTIVGWHKNWNLYHSFFVIPSWHCHCSWVFAPCPLPWVTSLCVSYCEYNLCLLLHLKSTFYCSTEWVLHKNLIITPISGLGKPKGWANQVEVEIKEWLQQPTPLKMPKMEKSLLKCSANNLQKSLPGKLKNKKILEKFFLWQKLKYFILNIQEKFNLTVKLSCTKQNHSIHRM